MYLGLHASLGNLLLQGNTPDAVTNPQKYRPRFASEDFGHRPQQHAMSFGVPKHRHRADDRRVDAKLPPHRSARDSRMELCRIHPRRYRHDLSGLDSCHDQHLPNGVPTGDDAVTEDIIHKITTAFHWDGHMTAAHDRQV